MCKIHKKTTKSGDFGGTLGTNVVFCFVYITSYVILYMTKNIVIEGV